LQQQDSVEQKAISLPKNQRIELLNQYSVEMGQMVHQEWVELTDFIITKYNDGYIKDDKNQIQTKGYAEEWLRFIRDQNPDKHRIKGVTKEL